jgi:hypothetical protein
MNNKPNADVLRLAGKLNCVGVVEGVEGSTGGAVKVLGAAGRSQVGVEARNLSDLKVIFRIIFTNNKK